MSNGMKFSPVIYGPNGTAQLIPSGGLANSDGNVIGTAEAVQSSDFRLDTSGYVSGEWAQMTGNSISLGAGTHLLEGQLTLVDGGVNHAVDDVKLLWATANGDNTTSVPSTSGASFLQNNDQIRNNGDGGGNQIFSWKATDALPEVVTLTATTTIFLVPNAAFSNDGDGAFRIFIRAVRLS